MKERTMHPNQLCECGKPSCGQYDSGWPCEKCYNDFSVNKKQGARHQIFSGVSEEVNMFVEPIDGLFAEEASRWPSYKHVLRRKSTAV